MNKIRINWLYFTLYNKLSRQSHSTSNIVQRGTYFRPGREPWSLVVSLYKYTISSFFKKMMSLGIFDVIVTSKCLKSFEFRSLFGAQRNCYNKLRNIHDVSKKFKVIPKNSESFKTFLKVLSQNIQQRNHPVVPL